jgi:hypothetical protein
MAQDVIDTSLFTIVYDFKVKTCDDQGVPVTDSMGVVTLVGTKVTSSMPYSNYVKLKDNYPELDDLYHESIMHYPTIWINYPSNSITIRETIMPNVFETIEKKETLNWILNEEDTITLQGLLCKKATTIYAQKEWVAYYTEEIPSSIGPWKLYGLPGMIVKASDKDNVHSFEVRELHQESLPIKYEKNTIFKEVKNKKLIKYRNKIYCNKKYPKKPLYYTNYSPLTAKTVTVIQSEKQIWLDGNLMLEKSHVFQPLEY